jgi:hypothetical protein
MKKFGFGDIVNNNYKVILHEKNIVIAKFEGAGITKFVTWAVGRNNELYTGHYYHAAENGEYNLDTPERAYQKAAEDFFVRVSRGY